MLFILFSHLCTLQSRENPHQLLIIPLSPPSQISSRVFDPLAATADGSLAVPKGGRKGGSLPELCHSTEGFSPGKEEGMMQSTQGTPRCSNWDGLGENIGIWMEPLELKKSLVLEKTFSPPLPAQLPPLFLPILPQLIQGKPS